MASANRWNFLLLPRLVTLKQEFPVWKQKYPVGTRIVLDHMEGEPDMPDGLRGTVRHVDFHFPKLHLL